MRSILVTLIVLLLGCGSTRTYVGDARPIYETSRFSFQSTPAVMLSSWTVDGTTQGLFASGISTMSGEQTITSEYTLVQESCGQSDYCREDTSFGTCSGTLLAIPGADYRVRPEVSAAHVSLRITIAGADAAVGTIPCVKTRSESRISNQQWERWQRDYELEQRERRN